MILARPALGPGRASDERLQLLSEKHGPALHLEAVAVDYGATKILEGIDLHVHPGELLALIGPSGSGKSSLLRCLAGFVGPSSGEVRFGERVVSTKDHSLPPEQRGIGFVFQAHALWPHMSARENVAYPWKARGVTASDRRTQADALLDRVGLRGLGDRRPSQLSGGQRQRVALARALAGDPQILLLDEPFSSVDVMIRDELLGLVRELVDESGLTTIFTTHDQQEAMTLSDRTAVLVGGRLVQVGTPREIYERPVSSFVARFMGASNLITVRIVARMADRVVVRPVAAAGTDRERADAGEVLELSLETVAPATDRAVLILRPEDLELCSLGSPPTPGAAECGSAELQGQVARTVERGTSTEVVVEAGGLRWQTLDATGKSWRRGDSVRLRIRRSLLLAN